MARTARQRHTTRLMPFWTTRVRVAGALGVAIMLTAGVTASAATPAVADPSGDALHRAPGFMDIVGAETELIGGTINFQMTVAASIPAAPTPTPPGTSQIEWDWALDTDPTTSPAGNPFPSGPGQARPAEFIVKVIWDGNSFSAILIDRTPLLSGGEATITTIGFTISGAEVQANVPANLLPSSFSWGAVTFYWSSSPGGTAGGHFVDSLQPFYVPFPG